MSQRWQIHTDRAVARTLPYFKFKDFPTEVAIRILTFATSAHLRTYQSLVVVSRAMQALVYETCLPHLPIMLHTRRHFDSFCLLIAYHPITVSPHIRTVWFVTGVKVGAERTFHSIILQKCTRITHIACNINLLRAFVGSSAVFAQHDLKHLTLVESEIPWWELLHRRAGRQLFTQLTHLRASGVTEFVIPDFCFASLTHLSFTCHDPTFGLISASPFDSARFPVLQRIVPSIPYVVGRLHDPTALRAGLAVDSRIVVIACPEEWKEEDMWGSARRGEEDLWMCA